MSNGTITTSTVTGIMQVLRRIETIEKMLEDRAVTRLCISPIYDDGTDVIPSLVPSLHVDNVADVLDLVIANERRELRMLNETARAELDGATQ